MKLEPKKDSDKSEESKEEIEIDVGLKGKIVEKVEYERSKHIFPYCNWKTVSYFKIS
jgi:hypothetical protein